MVLCCLILILIIYTQLCNGREEPSEIYLLFTCARLLESNSFILLLKLFPHFGFAQCERVER